MYQKQTAAHVKANVKAIFDQILANDKYWREV